MAKPEPAAGGKPERPVIPLRLPDLGEEGQPGARFVKRAVGITLGMLALLVVVALVASFTINMDVTVKSSGTLQPVTVHPVRALESGPVYEVLVKTGDTVRANAVLARLDTVALAANLSQLDAQYRAATIDQRRSGASDPLERQRLSQRSSQAQARLVSARAVLQQRMVEYDLGTNVDSLLRAYTPGRHVTLDQAVGDVRGAEAEIRLASSEADMLQLNSFDRAKLGTQMDQLRSQMIALRERMGRMELRAPIDGVVLTEQLERLRGAYVREGDQILEVASLGEWRAQLAVPERDVQKIKVGDRVEVEVQAFDQADRKQIHGKVTYVSPEPMGSGAPSAAAPAGAVAPTAPGMYRVIASLDEAQIREMGYDQFRRGYSVRGNVITRSGKIIVLLYNYLSDKLEKK
jgi:multidrug efflux pump subunit AcrA (membrane-fusion protein)